MSRSKKIKELLSHNVEEIIDSKSLEKKLKEGKQLIIKFGVDVTRPDIHLGHAVGLRKLKEFQDMGHKVVFLIGDATTRIGDPSGRDKTRPLLSEKEIRSNAKTYIKQVEKILDIKQIKIKRNSEWFDKMSMSDFQQLMTMVTHSQLISREAFQKRIKAGEEILAHELSYPIMQGYDSVVLRADLAVHADQLFNEHFGRMLQEKSGQDPQAIMTIPMLVGLDGKKKMSKSLDNYIGISESPEDMYGKTMSIPDKVIMNYFNLCTDLSEAQLKRIEKDLEAGKNPRDIKMKLARKIVEIYHSKADAEKVEKAFVSQFSKKEQPKDIEIFKFSGGSWKLYDLVCDMGFADSKSEARRLIVQDAIKVDGTVIDDREALVGLRTNMVVQVGKRKFGKIKVVK